MVQVSNEKTCKWGENSNKSKPNSNSLGQQNAWYDDILSVNQRLVGCED